MSLNFSDLLSCLAKTGSVPISTIIDFAHFDLGIKEGVRIVSSGSDALTLANFAEANGLAIQIQPVICDSKGNKWNAIKRAQGNPAKPSNVLISISSDVKVSNKINDSELDGEAQAVGKLLGYPECCVQNYSSLSFAESSWALKILNSSNRKPYPFQNNRLISHLGGISPLGELFPCSFDCKSSEAFSDLALKHLSKMGMSRLVENIETNARRKVYIDHLSGEYSLFLNRDSQHLCEVEFY
jgi:hypothetical protein